jgi:hypothetical protein
LTDGNVGIVFTAREVMRPTIEQIRTSLAGLSLQIHAVTGDVVNFAERWAGAEVQLSKAIPAIDAARVRVGAITPGKGAVDEINNVLRGLDGLVVRHSELDRAQQKTVEGIRQLGHGLDLLNTSQTQTVRGLTNILGTLTPFNVGVAAGATALLSLGKASIEAATGLEHQNNILKNFLELRGQGEFYESTRKSLDSLRETAKLAGADFETLNEAFRRAFEHTDDANEALRGTELALKVSISTGQGLHQVLRTLDAAYEGMPRSIRNFGIHLDNLGAQYLRNLPPAQRTAEINKLLEDRFGGLSGVYSDVATKSATLEVSFQRLQQNIGTAVLPAVSGLLNVVLSTGDAFDRLGRAIKGADDAFVATQRAGREPGAGQQPAGSTVPYQGVTYAQWAAMGRGQPQAVVTRTQVGTSGQEMAQLENLTIREMARAGRPTETDILEKFVHDMADAQERVKRLIKSTEKENQEAYTETTRHVRKQHEEQVGLARDAAKARLDALRDAEERARDELRRDRAAEEERYRLELRAIRDAEEAEKASFARRKEQLADWFAAGKQAIEDRKKSDLQAIGDAEKAEKASLDARRDAQRDHYARLKDELSDRLKAQEQGAEAAKRYQDDYFGKAIDKEKEQTRATVQGMRDRLSEFERTQKILDFGRDQAHQKEIDRLDNLARSRERDHQRNLSSIEKESRTKVQAIEGEERRQQQAIEAVKRSVDDADRARRASQGAVEAQYGTQRARYELAQAQAEGVGVDDPNRIVELRHAVRQAEVKEADQYYENIRKQNDQDLQLSLANSKTKAQDAKETEKTRADAAKEAENARYRAVKDAEDDKKQEFERTYRVETFWRDLATQDEVKRREKEIADAEEASRGRVKALEDERDRRKQVIDDNLTLLKTATDKEQERLTAWNKERLGQIEAEDAANKAYWEAQRRNVDAWVEDANGRLVRTHTVLTRALALEEAAAVQRWQAEKDKAQDAHNTIMGNLQEREGKIPHQFRVEREAIEAELEAQIKEIDKAYGSEEPGLLWQLERVKIAAGEELQANIEVFEDMKKKGTDGAAAYDALGAAIDRAGAKERARLHGIAYPGEAAPPEETAPQPVDQYAPAPTGVGGGPGPSGPGYDPEYARRVRGNPLVDALQEMLGAVRREARGTIELTRFGVGAPSATGGLAGELYSQFGGGFSDLYRPQPIYAPRGYGEFGANPYLQTTEKFKAAVDAYNQTIQLLSVTTGEERRRVEARIQAILADIEALKSSTDTLGDFRVAIKNATDDLGIIAKGPQRYPLQPATTLAQILNQITPGMFRFAIPGADSPYEPGGPIQPFGKIDPTKSGVSSTLDPGYGVPNIAGAPAGAPLPGVANRGTINITVNVDGQQALNTSVSAAAGTASGGGVGVTWGGPGGVGRE